MAKLVIKITVDKNVDPDLYDSVASLPRRQCGAVIRRLWRQGLQPANQEREAARRPADPLGAHSTGNEGTAVAAGLGSGGADGKLLRKHLDGQSLSGLSAFV
jgi:hypothetical protein